MRVHEKRDGQSNGSLDSDIDSKLLGDISDEDPSPKKASPKATNPSAPSHACKPKPVTIKFPELDSTQTQTKHKQFVPNFAKIKKKKPTKGSIFHTNPCNVLDEEKKFFQSNYQYNPQFEYDYPNLCQ